MTIFHRYTEFYVVRSRSNHRKEPSIPEPATREEMLSLLAVTLCGGGEYSPGLLQYRLENLGMSRVRAREILREAVEKGWVLEVSGDAYYSWDERLQLTSPGLGYLLENGSAKSVLECAERARCFYSEALERCRHGDFIGTNFDDATILFLCGIEAFEEGNSGKTSHYLDRIGAQMLQLWGRLYGIGLIALAVRTEKYRSLASLFPDEFLVGLFEELCLTHPNQSAAELWGEEGRTLFLASFKNREAGAVVHDWFVFREDFLAHGNPRAALEKTRGSFWAYALEGIVALAEEQNPTAALCAFEKVLKTYRGGRKRLFEEPELNWFYGITLYLNRENPKVIRKMTQLLGLKKVVETNDFDAFKLLLMHGLSQEIPLFLVSDMARHADLQIDQNVRSLSAFITVTALYAFRHEQNFVSPIRLHSLTALWGAFCAEVARALRDEKEGKYAETYHMPALLPRFEKKAEWEVLLERLEGLGRTAEAERKVAHPTGVVRTAVAYLWDRRSRELSLRLRKTKDEGLTWSKGTQLSVSAFAKGTAEMDERDLRVAQSVYHPGDRKNLWAISTNKALIELIGCERVFDAEDPDRRIEVVEEPFSLFVTQEEGGYAVHSNLSDDFDRRYLCDVQNRPDGAIVVVRPSKEEREILSATQGSDILFPPEAKARLTKYLEGLSSRTPVLSDLLKQSTALEKKKGDARVTFRVRPQGDRFHISALVRPLAKERLVCRPGLGEETVAFNVQGKALQVVRDLKAEAGNWRTMEAALASLEDVREDDTGWNAPLRETLELLDAVRAHPKEAVLEWPEGETVVVRHSPLSFDNFELSLTSLGSWFEMKGGVTLDNRSVLTVAELLNRIRSAEGNFIRLSDKEYVALTESFRRALERLEGVSLEEKKDQVKVSAFRAGLLEDLREEGVALKTDEAFQTIVKRIEAAESLVPGVPEGLRAELRDYQTEGFEWLVRLSAWGAGALLADDMGLGKTVQTIALLLARAKEGPALIVTPAAVLYNWVEELARFAPGLKITVFNREADRAKAVKKAGRNDVLLVTYGVLTSEADLLSTRTWATTVLDEAHTIKNRGAKMSKAAMRLTSDARVLLTGTPLQNHLSEIWNLFEFANPGLLGSYEDFSERYIVPIEKGRNRERQRKLKRLISPFILRRTKAEVLEELPEKTEITLRVTLSDDERALYETLRKRAADGLEAGAITSFEALAELTKLRRAVCHPKLIDESLPFASSKSEAFLDLVSDLMSGGHRTLVFSQFTSHLALIRRELEDRGIDYLYLDGATPAKERKALVEAFQTGTAPLFLISLKAGGTGLNLTAADYVVHLDPWWNPAVEDQASDRAYRIGQKNPVTIYRLIAEDTIEERILTLHETKKSLADALLEGSDVSSRLTRDEILALLAA